MNELSRESTMQYQELRRMWLAGRIDFQDFHNRCLAYYDKLHRIKASTTVAEAKQAKPSLT